MITKIAAKLDLREYDVLQIISIINARKKIDNSELVRLAGLPKTHLGRLLSELSEFLEPPSPRITVKSNTTEKFEVLLKDFENIENNEQTKVKIRTVLEKYSTQRPKPERSFDQFTATDETTIKRTVYLKERGDLYKRSLVFLGDDDLTSIAVALTNQTKRITVLEIDDRLIALLTKIAKENNLKIEVIKYDARCSLPPAYAGKFDTVFTDPPYTPSGVSLFLNRGIELLQRHLTSRIYLCYGNSDRAREREIRIQAIINEKALLVKEKIWGFNKYNGAESIGSSSSLYLCD